MLLCIAYSIIQCILQCYGMNESLFFIIISTKIAMSQSTSQMHTALKQSLSHPPLLIFPPSSLTSPAPTSRRAEQSGQEGEAELSGADNWIGVEARLPAAAAASSGKLPAPPPTSLTHSHRTHTEPLIGSNCCRHCFRNHAIER